MNLADSEIMAGILKDKNYTVRFEEDEKIIKENNSEEIIIVNTCIVKQQTENKILRLLEELNKGNKRVIVTGCLPSAYPEISEKFNFSFIGTNVYNIDKILEETINGKKVVDIKKDKKDKNTFPKLSSNKFISIVPISEGCLGNCSFCATRNARKYLFSYSQESIIKRIKESLSEGAKEIWLTSQDLGCYGIDKKTNIVNLLREIEKIEGKFKVRLGMMNPNYALKFLDDLLKIFESEKFYKFIHIPVQSGSENVLKAMNRNYKISDFLKLVEKFREKKASISTDIIVGFPTEDEDDFEKTINLIKKVEPDFLNLSKFTIRKNTIAEINIKKGIWKYDTKKIKDRSEILTKIFREILIKNNERWINWEGEILITKEKKSKGKDFFVGRNFAYKKVYIEKKCLKNIIGKFVNCKIINAGEILEGEIC